MSPAVQRVIYNARDESGRRYADRPDVLMALWGLAQQNRPAAGGDIDTEIKQIERYIRERRPSYNRDEVTQARY